MYEDMKPGMIQAVKPQVTIPEHIKQEAGLNENSNGNNGYEHECPACHEKLVQMRGGFKCVCGFAVRAPLSANSFIVKVPPPCDFTQAFNVGGTGETALTCGAQAVAEVFVGRGTLLLGDTSPKPTVEFDRSVRCEEHLEAGINRSECTTITRRFNRNQPVYLTRAKMPKGKKQTGGKTGGRGAEAPKTNGNGKDKATNDNGVSDGQLKILQTLEELEPKAEGKGVNSITIVEKLGGLDKFGPRGKVRAAMDKLSELGYVKSTKTGIKYAFFTTEKGKTFLASRASAGSAATR